MKSVYLVRVSPDVSFFVEAMSLRGAKCLASKRYFSEFFQYHSNFLRLYSLADSSECGVFSVFSSCWI